MKKLVFLLAVLTVSAIGATGAMALSLSAEGGYALSNGASVAIYATDAAWYNISFSVTDMYGNNEVELFGFDDGPGDYAVLSTTATPWLTDGFLLTFGIDSDRDGNVDYSFSSDSRLNTADKGIQHVYADLFGTSILRFGVEDMLTANNPDWDNGNDLSGVFVSQCGGQFSPVDPAAPVPEPATMLLFGTGLAGLAGFRTRKKRA